MHQVNLRLPAEDATPARNRTPWTILVLLSVAQFMVILDVTVVNVALPSIRTALRFAPQDLQWVVSAYVLMTGGLLLLGGRMADMIGRRRVFLTGLIVFTGASLASGLAPTAAVLIASRAAQGLGAALLSPAALSIITTTYTNDQRTTALSVWGAIGAGGAAAGVLLGGVLTTWLGWRSVFFINVPVGLLAAILTLRLVPTARTTARSISELDLAGLSPASLSSYTRSRGRPSTAGPRPARWSCSPSQSGCWRHSRPSSVGRRGRWCPSASGECAR